MISRTGSRLVSASVMVVLLSLQIGLATAAGPCRSIEYAELKDTSTERLSALHCEYGRLARKEQAQIPMLKKLEIEFAKLGLFRESRDIERTRFITSTGIKECLDMQQKISSALANREPPVALGSCEAAQ